jgi:hypothetical protein
VVCCGGYQQPSYFFIQYPEDVEKQMKIAKEFEEVSRIPFKNCAGAVDGILIWRLSSSRSLGMFLRPAGATFQIKKTQSQSYILLVHERGM